MSRWFLLSAFALLLDQASKLWIDHRFGLLESWEVTSFFNLFYARNTGAAFSFLGQAGGWQRWLFVALATVASLLLARWLWKLESGRRLEAAGVALLLGGALGNLIDRAVYGYVIDFFDFHWGDAHFAVFNVADVAINIGVALLLWDSLFGSARDADNA